MKYQDLKIGDALPFDEQKPIIHKGRAQWFGLKCVPKAESHLKAWLAIRGIYAFYPVTKARRRIPRSRVKFVEYERRYLPGYVFARFDGEPVWNRFFDQCPFAHDVIRYQLSGQPGPLNPVDLAKLHAMRSVDEARQESAKQARTIRKGDRVRFFFSGIEFENVEVLEISGMFGKVKLGLLGKDEIKVSLHDMQKMQAVAK